MVRPLEGFVMRLLVLLALFIAAVTIQPVLADDWDEDKIIRPRDKDQDSGDSDEEESESGIPADRLGMYFGNGDEFVQSGTGGSDDNEDDAPVRRSETQAEEGEEDDADAEEAPAKTESEELEAVVDTVAEEPAELRPLFGEAEPEPSDDPSDADGADNSSGAEDGGAAANRSEDGESAAGNDLDAESSSIPAEPLSLTDQPLGLSEAPEEGESEPAEFPSGHNSGLDALKPLEETDSEATASEQSSEDFELTPDAPEIKAPVEGDQHVWSVPPGAPGLENYSTYPAMEGLGKGRSKDPSRAEDSDPPLAPSPGDDEDNSNAPTGDEDVDDSAASEAEAASDDAGADEEEQPRPRPVDDPFYDD
jgi:hypothetical protein